MASLVSDRPLSGLVLNTTEDEGWETEPEGNTTIGLTSETRDDTDAEVVEDDDEQAMVAELENDWEPECRAQDLQTPDDGETEPEPQLPECAPNLTLRRMAEQELINTGHGPEPKSIVTYNQQYPHANCSAIIADVPGSTPGPSRLNPYAPFKSQLDWLVVRWAKLRGPGSTALSELLAIPGVQDALDLSFKSANRLNHLIDTRLPGHLSFHRQEIIVGGESFEFYSRDILEYIKALWCDPEFINDLIVEPERHYEDEDETVRLFHDMHTGKWWWNNQKAIERQTGLDGVTVVPIMLSSDKTQLTQFRNKIAYPVYLTLGNIPKHIQQKPSHQAQILLAYLPTTKLEHITNQAS